MAAVSLKQTFDDYSVRQSFFPNLPNDVQIHSLCFLDTKSLIDAVRVSKLFQSCVLGIGPIRAAEKGMEFLGDVNWLRVLHVCDNAIGVDFCTQFLGKVVGNIPSIPSVIANQFTKGFRLVFHPGSFTRPAMDLALDPSTTANDRKARVKKATHSSSQEGDIEISNTPRNIVFMTEHLRPANFKAPEAWPFFAHPFGDIGTQSHWSYQKIEPLPGSFEYTDLSMVPFNDRLYYHCAFILQKGAPQAYNMTENTSTKEGWPAIPLRFHLGSPCVLSFGGCNINPFVGMTVDQVPEKTAYGLSMENA